MKDNECPKKSIASMPKNQEDLLSVNCVQFINQFVFMRFHSNFK